MDLQGQVAIITGPSSGIGAGVARELDRAGMKLVLNGRRSEKLEALARELGDARTFVGDVSDETTPALLIGEAIMIYWPHPWRVPFISAPIPCFPNFQRMGLIR